MQVPSIIIIQFTSVQIQIIPFAKAMNIAAEKTITIFLLIFFTGIEMFLSSVNPFGDIKNSYDRITILSSHHHFSVY